MKKDKAPEIAGKKTPEWIPGAEALRTLANQLTEKGLKGVTEEKLFSSLKDVFASLNKRRNITSLEQLQFRDIQLTNDNGIVVALDISELSNVKKEWRATLKFVPMREGTTTETMISVDAPRWILIGKTMRQRLGSVG